MALPIGGTDAFRRLSGGFDALTDGRFSRWVTTAGAEEISERFTAPALMFLWGALCAGCAEAAWGPPSAAGGYSLGFYAAAVSARCLTLQTVLGWLDRVNAANARTCTPGRFALASVTGLSEADLRGMLLRWDLGEVEIANVNTARQVVVAGPASQVRDALGRLEGKVLEARELALDVPLHTPHVLPASQAVADWWQAVPCAAPAFSLISPVDGGAIRGGPAFKRSMLESLTSPTRFPEVVRGVAAARPERVIDLSPGGELARMAAWVDRDLRVLPLQTLWDALT